MERPPADEVMDYQSLAVYLRVAPGTLRHYVMRKEIPFIKVGVHVRFLKSQIDRWLADRSQRPKGNRAGAIGKRLSPGETSLPGIVKRPREAELSFEEKEGGT
ncbi:MAG: helix-turn-helix domain-containing protein [Spirochaetaceae bacterium]|jgi:excisionase family DNA binding protein|nr:helix-turn-helix domain-containing protein [Spirochaetaceae bacterium]